MIRNICKLIGLAILPTTIVFALMGKWQQSIALTFIYVALALQNITIEAAK